MQAYAVIAKVNADFADHDWAKENLKEEGLPDDFSTVWARSAYLDLKDYDEGVYFYGGRGAIYKALAKFEDSAIRSMIVGPHREDGIHVFSAMVKVDYGKKKQIIMLAIADAKRDADLAAFRDQALELKGGSSVNYTMREFRKKMKEKWPDVG
ncbi:MAG: hypothetical protein ACT4QB_21980 [Gammaproteobacteria bacterium]